MPEAQARKALARLEAFYPNPILNPSQREGDLMTAIDLSGWEKVMENIARDMYDGKLKKSDLSEAHILRTYETLESNAGKGYGKNWLKVGAELEQSDITTLKMRQNIFKFSMAKDVTMLEELNEAMTPDGKLANWKDFKAKALALNSKYNVNYLQAEFQTARQAGYHAQNWAEYERNAKRFPNLKYKTQGDNRVRKEHEDLNGVVKPINDKFWDSAYPPNGWRCRCYVEQTKDTADKGEIKLSDDVKPEFRINVGKSGQVFAEIPEPGGKPHPYFALAKSSFTEKELRRYWYKHIQKVSKKKLVDSKLKINRKELSSAITFTNAGIKEALNQPHKFYADKNLIIEFLDQITERAKYLGYTNHIPENAMYKAVHVFEISLNNEPSYLIYKERTTGEINFYSISDSDKVTIGLKK